MLPNDIGADSRNLPEGYAHERSLQNRMDKPTGSFRSSARKTEAHRLGRSVEDRHFRRRERRQGSEPRLRRRPPAQTRRPSRRRQRRRAPIPGRFRCCRRQDSSECPTSSPISRSRLEFELLRAPTTMMTSATCAQFPHSGLSILCRVADVANIGTHDVAEATMQARR